MIIYSSYYYRIESVIVDITAALPMLSTVLLGMVMGAYRPLYSVLGRETLWLKLATQQGQEEAGHLCSRE